MELLSEEHLRCDVCEHEFKRDDVIKIGYGDEKYVTCRGCFKKLLEE